MTIKKFFNDTGFGQVLGGLTQSVPILGQAVQGALAGGNAAGTSQAQVQTATVAALPASTNAPPKPAQPQGQYFLLGGTTYKRVMLIAFGSAAVIAAGIFLSGKRMKL
jgi:hypothetical protein